jgi:glycosyltransferase involved in cell wall biosynthesis
VIQVAAGLDEPGAGPSYSVTRLSDGLRELGVSVALHSVSGWRASAGERAIEGLSRHRQDGAAMPILRSLCLSRAMSRALDVEAQSADVIHTHGLWLMPNVYPAWAARAHGKPFVLSPRGMLGEAALRFSSARKRLFWSAFQARAVASAACLHATSQAEVGEIRAAGLSNPVALVPNGVDLPKAAYAKAAQPTVITLGRIHRKKGLADLVRAWSRIEAVFPDWRLRIVGPDEAGHGAELEALIHALGLRSVGIEPPLFGEEKERALAEADLFVLPTLNENFALTVAEALAAGTPAIVTKGAPWAELESHGCGWWVEGGDESLAAALAGAMQVPRHRLALMGEAGREWMRRSFSWDSVAGSMAEVYRWLAGQGEPPAQVRFASGGR